MKTPSASLECSLTDRQEHDRVAAIVAEFCRAHSGVTIATGLRPGGAHLFLVGILGERKRRAEFDVPRGVSREELVTRFSDACGIKIEPDDDWDW